MSLPERANGCSQKHCLTNSCSSCCPSWAVPLGRLLFSTRTESLSPLPNSKPSSSKTNCSSNNTGTTPGFSFQLQSAQWPLVTQQVNYTHLTVWWKMKRLSIMLHSMFLLLMVIWGKIIETSGWIKVYRCTEKRDCKCLGPWLCCSDVVSIPIGTVI